MFWITKTLPSVVARPDTRGKERGTSYIVLVVGHGGKSVSSEGVIAWRLRARSSVRWWLDCDGTLDKLCVWSAAAAAVVDVVDADVEGRVAARASWLGSAISVWSSCLESMVHGAGIMLTRPVPPGSQR